MKTTLATLSLLGLVAFSNANQCQFKSKDVIFPNDAHGDGTNGGLLRIAETSAGGNGDSDDQVELEIKFMNPTTRYNEYYLLSHHSNVVDAFVGANVVGGDSGSQITYSTGEIDGTFGQTLPKTIKLADDDLLFTTHDLKINDAVCSELDCAVKYKLVFEIGAAPHEDCLFSRSTNGATAARVYVRAHYAVALEIHYKALDGTVDFTHWNTVAVSTDVLVTQTDVDRYMSYEAANIQSLSAFSLQSNLILSGDQQAGTCLGEGTLAQNNTMESYDDGAFTGSEQGSTYFNNGLTVCKMRAYASIHQTVSVSGSGDTSSASYEDVDTDSDSTHKLYNDGGFVELWISQYSQMGDTQDSGSQHTAATEPSGWDYTRAGAAIKTSGADYRYDICNVRGESATQIPSPTDPATSDPDNLCIQDGAGTYHCGGAPLDQTTLGGLDAAGVAALFANYNFDSEITHDTEAYVTSGNLKTDIESGSFTLVSANAIAGCRYTIEAPIKCQDASGTEESEPVCTYTPMVYISAWFDEKIPEESRYDASNDQYNMTAANKETTVTNEDTGASTSSTQSSETGNSTPEAQYSADNVDNTPARRLRSAPKLLRAAAQRKLAAPEKPRRVHFMRVHLTHKH